MLILIIVLLILFAGIFAGCFFYNMALNRYSDKSAALHALPPIKKQPDEDQEKSFFESTGAQDAYITAFDGLKLHAIFKEQSSKWVIIQHGYASRAKDMNRTAKMFYEQSYSVLVPDARGHGESEGKYIGMGWHDRKDLAAWVSHIISKDPGAQIVLYGISMGGAAVMMYSGEALPSNIKGIIEDCGYSSVRSEFYYQLSSAFKLPGFIALFIMFFADIFTRILAGYSINDGVSTDELKKAKLPMLFLHGESDKFVPFFMLDEVYNAAASADKQKLSFPNAGHGGSAASNPELYRNTVLGFTSRVFS